MRTLLDREVHVHYGQMYVFSFGDQVDEGDEEFDLAEHCAGQWNGLCGAVVSGSLFLITGLHTGNVPVTVELHETPPAVDESWEEIVEVSFTPAGSDIALEEWGGGHAGTLELERKCYRVRYCATGMDTARESDTRMDDEPVVDRYLLQFWPAPHDEDRIVRVTSGVADYWHEFAQNEAPAHVEQSRIESRRLREEEFERQQERARERERNKHAAEVRRWGGQLPSERLQGLGGNASALARLDHELVDRIEHADPSVQRAVARWAAHRAYEVAGLAEVSWIAPALAALDRGDPLPAPFDDFHGIWDRVFSDPEVLGTDEVVESETVTYSEVTLRFDDTSFDIDDPMSDAPEMDNPLSRKAAAIPALFTAPLDDPLLAVCDVLHTAAFVAGADARADLLAEARARLQR